MEYKIISKDTALSGSILGDISKEDNIFDYVVECRAGTFKIRSAPEEIYDKLVMKVCQYMVDDEQAIGDIGIDIECETPEGETFNAKNYDVCQWYDIIHLVPPKKRTNICEAFIKHHSGECND